MYNIYISLMENTFLNGSYRLNNLQMTNQYNQDDMHLTHLPASPYTRWQCSHFLLFSRSVLLAKYH